MISAENVISLLAPARDFFNIIFFIVACVVTILTYLTARKSLLQPIKTEIIKRQLELYIELNIFIDAHSHYVCGEIPLYNIVFYYVHLVPALRNLLPPELAEMLTSCQGSLLVHHEDLTESTIRGPDGLTITPLLRTHIDGRFALVEIQLDKEYFTVTNALAKYRENPFLANELARCLEQLESWIKDDLRDKMAPELERTINENTNGVAGISDTRTLTTLLIALSVKVNNNFNRQRQDYRATFLEMKSIIRTILQTRKYI